jgi:hypothetical protein
LKDLAISSGNWTIIGKYDGRKAALVLKNPDKTSLPLSEKDLKPLVTVLDMVRTMMTEETE